MRKKILLSISLIITAITLLYLLFANLFRDSFMLSDWIIVTIDLSAKIIIESIILFTKRG